MNIWHEDLVNNLPKPKVDISVVTCLCNERDNLESFYQRTKKVVDGMGLSYEIVFVDDGSTDDSLAVLKKLAQKDPGIKVIRLSRNFGQHMAMTAGFRYCRGKRVLWIDSDLQENPEDLPKLMKKMDEGYDIVCGERKNYGVPFLRRISSAIFFKTFNLFSGLEIPIGISTLRLLSNRVVSQFNILTEHSRFITGLQFWQGFPHATVEVTHNQRVAGKSKYNLFKMLKLASDSVLSFTKFPLRIATFLGLVSALICLAITIYTLIRYVFVGVGINLAAFLNFLIYLMASMLFLILGIIGEYLGRVYVELLNRPLYIISEKINVD